MPRALLNLMEGNRIRLRRRIRQQFHAKLAAGSRWNATPVRLAKLLRGGGYSFEQAVGLNFALVPDAFHVLVLNLAQSHRKIITLRLVFALAEMTTFDINRWLAKDQFRSW